MGCSSSYPEPPRQQPSTQEVSPIEPPTVHPSLRSNQPQSNVSLQKPAGKGFTRETLERYIALEKEIHTMEESNTVMKAVAAKEDALGKQHTHCAALAAILEERTVSRKKEKADVDLLTGGGGGIGDLVANNEQLAQEQEEFVEALNKEEIAQRELTEAKRQQAQLENDLTNLRKSAEKFYKLYDERDDLLSEIFSGDYGSVVENTLENELDLLLDRKERIAIAKYKWQNSRVLIQYATNQLVFAVKRWTEVANMPHDNSKNRYTMTTEVRNNLVAANQNITSAQRYLENIEFPYCKPAEMITLTRATNNIYTDMQTVTRHGHALNVYSVTHKRATALLQWFDHVIKKTIVTDAQKANKEAEQKEQELTAERVKLIKERVRAELGQEIQVDLPAPARQSDDEDGRSEFMVLAAKTGGDGEENVIQSGEVKGESDEIENAEDMPMPSTDDLFGNIEDLKRKHEEEMSLFKKQQDLNKARVEQGLEEKLRSRRSRRRKVVTK